MVTPPSSNAITLPYRKPVVLAAFCIGMAFGMMVMMVYAVFFKRHCVAQQKQMYIIHASSCDVSRVSTSSNAAVRFRVVLKRIVDGDTIRVMWHGENQSVRLLGIDAPERKQPGSSESTECLRTLLAEAETVDLEFENDTPHRDSLGRLLAHVWHGDMHLNLEMVKRGHAGLYKNGGKGKYGDILRHAIPTTCIKGAKNEK